MAIITLEDFYKETAGFFDDGQKYAPDTVFKNIGHFNVFDVGAMMKAANGKPPMAYNRRAYYKINFISGRNTAEYADKVIEIEKHALLFGTPKVPYHWQPHNMDQSGHFCLFTEEFLIHSKSGVVLDELPIFKPGNVPVFEIIEEQAGEIEAIFKKMHKELASDYVYKYDLLRNYLLELIHYGQKLQPVSAINPPHTAAARVSSLFSELLERQFPIESPKQKLELRTAKDYADNLSVHVNHLNKVLKENTGKTTTEIISSRIAQEAKILLKQTDWNISEIAWCLGFEEVAHFSNFFKKQTSVAPVAFRV